MLLGVGSDRDGRAGTLTKAFAAGSPSRISVLSLTQVVFAMGYDVAIEGRVLGPSTLLGFLLVLAPTAWITLRAGRTSAESIEASDEAAASAEMHFPAAQVVEPD